MKEFLEEEHIERSKRKHLYSMLGTDERNKEKERRRKKIKRNSFSFILISKIEMERKNDLF